MICKENNMSKLDRKFYLYLIILSLGFKLSKINDLYFIKSKKGKIIWLGLLSYSETLYISYPYNHLSNELNYMRPTTI